MERREFLFDLAVLAATAAVPALPLKPAAALPTVPRLPVELLTVEGRYSTYHEQAELVLVSPRLGIVASTGKLAERMGRFRVQCIVPKGEEFVVAMKGADCTVEPPERRPYP